MSLYSSICLSVGLPVPRRRLIRFSSMDAFRSAMAGEHSAEILGDIANFTSVRPIVQVNEAIEFAAD